MYKITKPLPFGQLETNPEISGMPTLSDDIQQTLSLLSGFDGQERQLIVVSPTGILRVAGARVASISNILADQDSYTWNGSNVKSSEVLIKAHPDNTGRVWANVDNAASANNGYPLDAGDYVKFSITNLTNLYLFIATDTEKAIIIATR